ncbi:MAG: SusC/RagA family TonB-linked outer membrane protein [Bacteroidetes bacterium]|nr:SusC/RagA family TonB-linked outer membrane protein [Bacteroidota bacterium]
MYYPSHVLLLATSQLLAQTRTVTGTVTDDKGAPLNGVTINAIATNKKVVATAVTDASGSFSIKVPQKIKGLQFSFVGFEEQMVAVETKSNITVQLSSTSKNLDEIVVVGYSKTTKEAFTGSAKTVSAAQITNKSVSNVSQALAGEIAGVTVVNTSGQPGSSATIRIRGLGSVNGNRDPLYVVDGVPYFGTLNSINPDEIANIVVLKDAAATAIYGSRGANGVIVITTKTGRGKKSFVTVDAKFGTNNATLPRYDILTSPEEYIALSWEAMYNQGVILANPNPVNYANTNLFSASGISPNNNMWNVATGADLIDPTTKTVKPGVTRKFDPERWQDYAFQPASRSEVNVQLGGGDAKSNYFTSFGYLQDIGYIINSDYKRLNGRVSINHEVKPWLSTVFNVNFSQGKTNNNGQASNSNSIFWFVDNIPSIYPLFLRDASGNKVPDPIFGGYQFDYGSTGRKFGSLTNAIADATYNTVTNTKNELTANTSVNVKFSNHLILENRLGIQYYAQNFWSRNNKFYGSSASQNGFIGQTKYESANLNLLNMLHYTNSFNAHNIEVLAAHEATDYRFTSSSASGYNLVDNYSLELANAIVINPTATSYTNTNKIESYFAQTNYNYQNTYYLSGTIRRDGSSRFTKGNTWGTFGSVGAGVVLSKLDYFKKWRSIPYLKLKASYGILGDQDGLSYYPGMTSISIGNLNNNPSFGVPVPGNPNLTWETSKTFQTGLEFRVGNFLEASIEYYIRNTDNLIFQRRVGISNGYALITVNDGQLRNSGIDFELTGHIIRKKDFYVDLGINGNHYTNQITKMPIDPSTGAPKVIDVQGNFAWSKGHSVYDYYIRNFAGVDPADGRTTWSVYYDDLNGNGRYDVGEGVANLEQFYSDNPSKKGTLLNGVTKTYSEATQYYVGKSAIPKVRGALNFKAGYKSFDISVQFLYSIGGYAYDGAYAGLMQNQIIGSNNWSTDIRRRWQKPGDITDVPRLSNNATTDQNVTSASSRFLTSANYLTLNNIRIGYSLPQSLLKRTGLFEEVSFFVAGDNLWLSSARKGFNPATAENGESDTYRYSPLSTITFGTKIKF